jgi:serine/threonine-protein kinase
MREGAALPSTAAVKTSRFGHWAHQLRGDLDAIILRALEFESTQRYAGARELADDLQNWLDGMPVTARSQTAWYRGGRYLRRHWLGASSVLLIFLLISGYALTVTWQSQRLAEQRNVAEAARVQAESIRDFLIQVFGSVDPQSQLSRGKSIEQLLIEGVERARSEYADQPLMAAQLLMDMADVLARRGRLDSARLAYEDAGRMRAEVLGQEHPETLSVAILLADVVYRLGEGDAALQKLRQHLQTAERIFGSQSDEVIDALTALGPIESVHGDLAAAEEQMRRALSLQSELYPRDLPAPDQPLRRALMLNQLGVVLMRTARYQDAALVQEESLTLHEQYAGAFDSRTLESRKNLGFVYRMLKRPDEAQRLLEQTLQDERELYDGAHWQIAYTLGHLANLASDAKDYARAITLWEEAEAETRAAMGDDYYWIDSARYGQARSMLLSDRQEEGHRILQEMIQSPDTEPSVVKMAQSLLERFPPE